MTIFITYLLVLFLTYFIICSFSCFYFPSILEKLESWFTVRGAMAIIVGLPLLISLSVIALAHVLYPDNPYEGLIFPYILGIALLGILGTVIMMIACVFKYIKERESQS